MKGLLLLLASLASASPYLFSFAADTGMDLELASSPNISPNCTIFGTAVTSCQFISITPFALGLPLLSLPSGGLLLKQAISSPKNTFHYTLNQVFPATFVQTAQGIVGTIPSPQGFYHIHPCSAYLGCHTLSTVDSAKLETGTEPDVHEEDEGDVQFKENTSADPQCTRGIPSPDWRVCCPALVECKEEEVERLCIGYGPPCLLVVNQTVSVSYTAEAYDSVYGYMEGLVALAMAETNQAYRLSFIPIELQLVGNPELTQAIAENGDIRKMLMDFRASSKPRANLHILLVSSPSSCGMAFLNCAKYADFTCYAVVRVNCATGYYSFGHEIGHLQGANHNMEAMSWGDDKLDNHGLVLSRGYASDGCYRTIMAYQYVSELRIPYFSNPEVRVEGLATGILGKADNVRVLRLSRYLVANLTESQVAPTMYPSSQGSLFPSKSPSLSPSKLPTTSPTIRVGPIYTKFPTVGEESNITSVLPVSGEEPMVVLLVLGVAGIAFVWRRYRKPHTLSVVVRVERDVESTAEKRGDILPGDFEVT